MNRNLLGLTSLVFLISTVSYARFQPNTTGSMELIAAGQNDKFCVALANHDLKEFVVLTEAPLEKSKLREKLRSAPYVLHTAVGGFFSFGLGALIIAFNHDHDFRNITGLPSVPFKGWIALTPVPLVYQLVSERIQRGNVLQRLLGEQTYKVELSDFESMVEMIRDQFVSFRQPSQCSIEAFSNSLPEYNSLRDYGKPIL